MTRLLMFFAALSLLGSSMVGPISRPTPLPVSSVSQDAEKPELVINVPRHHMLSAVLAGKGYGKTIEFSARLKGELGETEEFYCLDEVWDWGDGTESVHEPDCEPYTPGTELKRDFSDSHAFGKGRWNIAFALMHLDEVVLKTNVDIRVH